MQPVWYLAAVFALHRNAVTLAICLAGQWILTNFLKFKALGLQPYRQILARLVIRYRLAVYGFHFKAGDQRAARGFLHDTEGAGAFPATGFAGVVLINFRFTIDKHASQYPVGFTPCIQHFLARTEHFVQRRQQMRADNIVLLRLDLEAGVLLGDFLHRRQQGRQVFNIAGVGGNSIEQRFTLVAVALVAHIENLFQLRIMGKHPVVKVGGELRAGLYQQRDRGFNGGDSMSIKHGRSSFQCYKLLHVKCIL